MWQRARRLWPHVPLALLVLGGGLANVLAGLEAEGVRTLPALRAGTEALGDQASLGVLGSGAQMLLGAGLLLVGLGLMRRLRVAWSFALLLLLITVGVNLARGDYGPSLVVPSLVLVGLLLTQHVFMRSTLLGSSIASLMSIAAIMAYGAFGTFLLGADFDPPVRSLTEGLYFTVVTLSTVGYGDIGPASMRAQFFVMSLIVVGLSVFATAVVSVVGPALSNRLSRFLVPDQHTTLNDHIILAGSGAVAHNTARELDRRGASFVQVIREGDDPEIPERPVVRGEPSEDTVLEEAGLADARMVVAAVDDDGENAFIALAAKDLNPKARVVAVASTPRAIRRIKRAGADLVFAPAAVGSRLLTDLIEGEEIPPQFVDLLEGKTRPS